MKLKKLQLNKQLIMNLNESEMGHLKGGGASYGGAINPCRPSDTCPPGPTQYTGLTGAPRCCEYGCCETVGCYPHL